MLRVILTDKHVEPDELQDEDSTCTRKSVSPHLLIQNVDQGARLHPLLT